MIRALVVGFALLAAAVAHAGDRQLESIFVNMTPDAQSSEASKQCVKAIDKRIAADYTHARRIGETALRKQAGKTAGEPMMSWPLASFDRLRGMKTNEIAVDAFILVDCRPEARELDIVVAPPTNGLARMQLRRVALDDAALKLATEALLRRARSGFSP
jgi:hypothetical protein